MLAAFIPSLLCAALLGQQAAYDIRRGDDLSRLRTFGFKAVTPSGSVAEETTTYDSVLMDDRINAAIAAQLESRGLQRDDQHPDAWVIVHRTFTEASRFYPFPDPWFANGWGWPYAGSRWIFEQATLGRVYTRETIRGTLKIDLQDAKSGALMWRGVGDKRAHQTSKPSHRAKRVDGEVEEIFELFPLKVR